MFIFLSTFTMSLVTVIKNPHTVLTTSYKSGAAVIGVTKTKYFKLLLGDTLLQMCIFI